jgi:glycosyltransferase involved in cell wall biosynthesis
MTANHRPFFSVVIPVFNRAHVVMPTLRAVQDQTFSDFECIVVDDGSNDSAALRSLVENVGDPRFRYVWRPNGGGGAARNTGIEAATGEYIAFLDSDDRFLPDKLERDAERLATGDEGLVLFSQVLVDRGGNTYWVKPPRAPRVGEPIAEYLCCARGFVQTSTIVLRRDLAKAVRFAENLPFGQDTDFALRLAGHGARFEMAPDPRVIMRDVRDPGRITADPPYRPMLQWLEQARPLLTRKAYYAYRGWHIARLASSVSVRLAIRLYLDALVRGALPLKLAVVALAQIVIPRERYRELANRIVSLRGIPKPAAIA